MNRVITYTALAILAITFITMPVSVPVFKSSAQYSIFNTGPLGLSDFAKLCYQGEKTVVPVLAPLDVFNISSISGVLFIIGPNLTFTKEEIDSIRGFLEKGNTVVIADDFGTGNEVLQGLNLPIRFSKYPLHDFFYDNDDRLIWVTRIENPMLAKNVKAILTNEPSAIIVARKGNVYTSRVAIINMHMRMFPIMVETKYRGGRVIVISDPDIFANMQFDENKIFLKNLINYLGEKTFYFDEAHHPDFNLYSAGTMTVKNTLSKKTAKSIVLIMAVVFLLKELNVVSIAGRLIARLLRRFLEEAPGDVIELARELGIDEVEFKEMLSRMGD